MANYQEVRDKLTNTQLSKLKSAAKNQRATILNKIKYKTRLNKKNFEDKKIFTSVIFKTKSNN